MSTGINMDNLEFATVKTVDDKIAEADKGVTSVNKRTGAVTLAKTDVGLGNVDNVKQASMSALDNHITNNTAHITGTERTYWNNKSDNSALINHNIDPSAHGDIRSLLWDAEGRIERMEDMFLNNITGNPFMVTFGNLYGVIVTGVWNQPQARIEF